MQAAVSARVFRGAAPAPAQVVEEVVLLLLWGAATPGILWSAARFPIARRRWPVRVALHLAAAAAFILALNLVGPLITRLLLGLPVSAPALWHRGVLDFVRLFHLALIAYAFVLGCGHYLAALDARREEASRADRLRADLAEAQLRALRLQLQPHFLFNALNAVGSLILTGRGAEAFDVVGRLGDLLRALLATEHRDEVSLREELDLTRAYLAIEHARFGDRLRSSWEIAPDAARALVPPMLLQPLVENAIRHGVARRPDGGAVVVRAARAGGRLRLEVCDDGPGPAALLSDPGTGIGLENARRRLRRLYGAEQRLELRREDGWTRTVVELPFRVAAGAESAA